MNSNPQYENNIGFDENKGNPLLGALGAVLGAAVGCIPWILVAVYLDIVSGWLGFLIGFLCCLGWKLLGGKQHPAKLPVCLLVSALAVCAAVFFTYYVYFNFRLENYSVSVGELWNAIITHFGDIGYDLIINLALGLVFAILAVISSWRGKKESAEAKAASQQTYYVHDASKPSDNKTDTQNTDDPKNPPIS